MQEQDKGASAPKAGSDDFELPNARLVNKTERERRKVERRLERRKRRSEGEHKPVVAEVCARHPNDVFSQLKSYLRKAPQPALTGLKRDVGRETRTEFGNTLRRALNDLRKRRAPIRNLNEFGRKQALCVIKGWADQGLSPKTIRCWISHLRKFVTLMGKPHEIPDGKLWQDILSSAGISIAKVSQVRTVPKSFTSMGIDPIAKAAEVAKYCAWCAMYMLLALAFGLRLKECVELNPFESDLGNTLHLMHGTKGRRPRHVDLSTDPIFRAFQLDVLAKAKELALRNRKSKLRIPEYEIARMINRSYYIFRKCGITAKDEGVVFHGLRHEYALQDFQERSGLPAPVLAQVPPRIYEEQRAVVDDAESGTARQLGHGRGRIYGAYGGRGRALGKDCLQRQRDYLVMIQGSLEVAEAVAAQGVTECWIVGLAADGLPLAPLEPIGFAVQFGPDPVPADLPARRSALEKALATLGRPFSLSVRLERPPEGLEVIFSLPKS